MLLAWCANSSLAYTWLPNGDHLIAEWKLHRFAFDGVQLTAVSVEYWWNSLSPRILQLELSEVSVCEQVLAEVEQHVLTPMEILQLRLEGDKNVRPIVHFDARGQPRSDFGSGEGDSASFFAPYDFYVHRRNAVFPKLEFSEYLVSCPGF